MTPAQRTKEIRTVATASRRFGDVSNRIRSATAAAGVVMMVMAAWLAGCGGPPPVDEPIETVDVAPPPVIDPDADLKALRPQARVQGTLPPAFPADVPLHRPSTVVASGGGGGDPVWVELKTSDSVVRVRQQLGAQLRAAGWTGSIGADTSVWTRDRRRVELTVFAADDGSARYRMSIE